jgi:hypothetical protein
MPVPVYRPESTSPPTWTERDNPRPRRPGGSGPRDLPTGNSNFAVLLAAVGIAVGAMACKPAVAQSTKTDAPAEAVTLKSADGSALFPPPTLKDGKATVHIPAAPREACYGGGGRYLILRLPDVKQLAVFDASAGRVVKYLPLAEADAKFAATRTHLFLAYSAAGVVQRWALGTWERELTRAGPPIGGLAAGHDTAGPVFAIGPPDRVAGGAAPMILDPASLTPWPVRIESRPGREGPFGTGGGLLVSANGELLVTPTGTYRVAGKTLSRTGGMPANVCRPTADGTHLCSFSGLLTAGGEATAVGRPEGSTAAWQLPAADAPFRFSVAQWAGPRRPDGQRFDLRLHVGASPDAVLTVTDDDFFEPLTDCRIGPFPTWDRHLFVMPRAGLIVAVRPEGRALEVRRLDLEAGIRRAEPPVTAVLDAPGPAVRGQAFRYLPRVAATKGPVSAKLAAAPAGMRLTADGLAWDVPRDFAQAEASARLVFAGAAGQESSHTVRISVYDPAKVPAAIPVPGPAPAAAVPAALNPAPRRDPPAAGPEGKTEVKLPGVPAAVSVGGGGRYLIFLVPAVKQLAVLDTAAGRVIRSLPVDDPDVAVAATRTHVFAATRRPPSRLDRYVLGTWEKDLSAPSPMPIRFLAAGADSAGPLFAMRPPFATGPGGIEVIDPGTLKLIPIRSENRAGGFPASPTDGFRGLPRAPDVLVANAAGDLVVNQTGTYRVSGRTLIRLSGAIGPPTADGSHVCVGAVILTADGRPVGKAPGDAWLLPAADAPFLVAATRRPRAGPVEVRLLAGPDPGAVVPLPLDDVSDRLSGLDFSPGAWSEHLFVLPRARRLVAAVPKSDVVEVRPLDVAASIRKAERPVVAVLDAPGPAVRGARFRYLPDAVATRSPVTARLDFGPEGMTLTADGLAWDVPKDYPGADVVATLTLSAPGAAEVSHVLRIAVGDAATRPPHQE